MPSNDFSLYDHVLDSAIAVGAIVERFPVPGAPDGLARYFAMARGGEVKAVQVVAPLELTKWFDTNYHQVVPEISPDTTFSLDPSKALGELKEAAAFGIEATSVLIGPFTFLLLSATRVHAFMLLGGLVAVYLELLAAFSTAGVGWVHLDEPAVVEDRGPAELDVCRRAYQRIAEASFRPRMAVSTYFGYVGETTAILADLPLEGMGLEGGTVTGRLLLWP